MGKRKTRTVGRPKTVRCLVCGRTHRMGVQSFGWCPACPPTMAAREASASCALDGETQHCEACVAGEHRCGRREITAAERELVEAAMRYVFAGNNYGPLHEACKAVRAEREKERK